MRLTCTHVASLPDVGPGLEVCESCMETGGTWHHLRQCLTCGRTGCCDSSVNRHASTHAREAGHPVMRSLEEGEDWSWCFEDEKTLRREADGSWHDVDPFYEAGLWYAQRRASETGSVDAPADERTDDGFPIGNWLETYRGLQRDGELDPEQLEALEALPGWQR